MPDMEKTAEDKWEFLEALYQHGPDVEALRKVLPKWTKAQLLAVIKRFRHRAKKRMMEGEEEDIKRKPPLEQWIGLTTKLHEIQGTTNQLKRRGRKAYAEVPKDHAPLMGKVMMYAACFEEHYQGSEPDAPNYSEIYRYLAQLLEGKEPTQLSPGSADKVLEILGRIKKVVLQGSLHDHSKYLERLPISYLSSDAPEDDFHTTEGASHASSKKETGEGACPLFQDAEEEADTMELEPGDPYYEVKKEKLMKKLEMLQQESAKRLQFVPGVNPLELPINLLMKSTVTPSCLTFGTHAHEN